MRSPFEPKRLSPADVDAIVKELWPTVSDDFNCLVERYGTADIVGANARIRASARCALLAGFLSRQAGDIMTAMPGESGGDAVVMEFFRIGATGGSAIQVGKESRP